MGVCSGTLFAISDSSKVVVGKVVEVVAAGFFKCVAVAVVVIEAVQCIVSVFVEEAIEAVVVVKL